jgi:hypothetical protein
MTGHEQMTYTMWTSTVFDHNQYLLAVRKRLRVLPDSSLLIDSCFACHGRDLTLPEFKLDPHHDRHNVRVLAELARLAGAGVRTDQHPLEEVVVSTIDPLTGEGSHELYRSDKHDDLLVILSAKCFLVEVTIPRATAPNIVDDSAMAAAGFCTANAEKDSAASMRRCASTAVWSWCPSPCRATVEWTSLLASFCTSWPVLTAS